MRKKGIDYSKEFCKIDFKEKEGEFFSRGYVATTHIDSVGDKIMKETLDKWSNEINSSNNLKSNPVSIHHDREDMNLAGLGSESKVEKLDDGEFGLWVETHHNKAHPDFEKTKYEIDNKFITHYSIEYDTDQGSTTHKDNVDGNWIRSIEPETNLLGYGLASPRTVVNDSASIAETGYKEIIKIKPANAGKQEVTKMQNKEDEPKAPAEEAKPEAPKEEATPEATPEAKAPAEEAKKEEEAPKEEEAKESAKGIAAEVKEKIKAEVIAEMKETTPANAPMIKKGEKIENKEKVEVKEIAEFKEGVLGKKASVDEQWAIAGRLHSKLESEGKELGNGTKSTLGAGFEVKEGQIEYKQLTTATDAQSSDLVTDIASYYQTPTVFNDVYGPAIINQMNDEAVTWNLLKKDNMSGASTITFRARTAANATAGSYGYGSTPGWDSQVTRKKLNLNFVSYYVEVKVEDETIELAKSPGGIGDVYSDEIKWSTLDLITKINQDLLTSATAASESEPYTFETTIITSGSLYGRTVTDAGYLTLAAAGVDDMSSAPITLKKMRAMIRGVVQKGARVQDIVFIGDHLQVDFIKALIQDMQRIVPTSARVGFEGRPEFDGVPIYADKDANTDDLFLIDLAHTKVAMKKAPTYVEFGKTDMFRKGIVWLMCNLYCTAPNHNYWIYGLATT